MILLVTLQKMKKLDKSTIKQDVLFLYEIGAIRFVERTWRQFFQGTVANNAEHMFRVAWTALVMGGMKG